MEARAWAALCARAPPKAMLHSNQRRAPLRAARQPSALSGGGAGGSCGGGSDLQSLQARIAAHQAQLEEYVQREQFDRAAAERDALMPLQLRARQLELDAQRQQNVLHAIGTVIRHRRYGYRGVIAGACLRGSVSQLP